MPSCQQQKQRTISVAVLAFLLLVAFSVVGCLGPKYQYYPTAFPTVHVLTMHWTADGSTLIVVEAVQDSSYGTAYGRVVQYDRAGKLVRSVHVPESVLVSGPSFIDPQATSLYLSSGYLVDPSNGVPMQLLSAGTPLLSVSPDCRYMIAGVTYGTDLYDLQEQRVVNHWGFQNAYDPTTIVWRGDSLFGMIRSQYQGPDLLIVFDTALVPRQRFIVPTGVKGYSPILLSSDGPSSQGSFWIAASTGLWQLVDSVSAKRVLTLDAGQAEISRDGKLALTSSATATYPTYGLLSNYAPSYGSYRQPGILQLSNLETGASVQLADSVYAIALAPTGDRAAYTRPLDDSHDKVFVVPVTIP